MHIAHSHSFMNLQMSEVMELISSVVSLVCVGGELWLVVDTPVLDVPEVSDVEVDNGIVVNVEIGIVLLVDVVAAIRHKYSVWNLTTLVPYFIFLSQHVKKH